MRRDAHFIKLEKIPTNLIMHSAYHNETNGNNTLVGSDRRHSGGAMADGGFCEVCQIIFNSIIFFFTNRIK